MNITIVCDVLGEENNGTTLAAMNLIRALRGKGHTVTILCPDAQKQGAPGYAVVPTRNLGIFNGYVKSNGVQLAKPDDAVIRQAIQGADIVHVMLPFVLGRRAAQLAKAQGVPVSAGFHAMAENFGAKPENIRAAIGPNIGMCHFETDHDVPDAMRAAFGPEVDAYIEKRGEKYHLDLKQINAMVLRRCGVEHIDLSRDCTVCSCDRFWSHRATGGERGSQGAVIVCQEVTG